MQCGNRLQVGYSQLQRTIYFSAKFINFTSSHSIPSCLTSSMDRMSSKQSVDNDRTYALYIVALLKSIFVRVTFQKNRPSRFKL